MANVIFSFAEWYAVRARRDMFAFGERDIRLCRVICREARRDMFAYGERDIQLR